MNHFFRLVGFGLTALPAFGQTDTLPLFRGRVADAETKKPVPFANVIWLGDRRGTVTDAGGTFVLRRPAGSVARPFVVSFVGYQTDTLAAQPGQVFTTVLLRPAAKLLGEVLVTTGVTRATLIRQNPVPIVAISQRTIERTAGSNIIDVLVHNTPGLNAVKTGPNVSKPFIRGLGYNRVLTLYDGVRQEGQQWGDEHGIEVDGYGVERAEVIKGPASLLYGSDALAGVVSLIPAYPKPGDAKLRGSFISEYQSNNNLLGTSLGLGSGGSRWAWNVRGSYRMAANYQNRVDGRVYNTGFRERTLTGMLARTTARSYARFGATLYDNLQGIPDGSRDSLTRRFTRQVYESDGPGPTDDVKHRPVVPDADLRSYRLSPLIQHIQHYRLYANAHYQLGAGELDALLAFQQNVRREYNHPTAPDQPGLYVRLSTYNYGLRYNLPDWGRLATTVGVNGMYQINRNRNATDFPIPDYQLFDLGTFVFLTYKAPKLTVSGGLRHDSRSVRGNDFYTRVDPATGFGRPVFAPDTIGADLTFPVLRQSFGGVSASVGLTYEFSPRLALKANVARGYRAPNLTEIAANGLDPGAKVVYIGNRSFRPEFSWQQDVGLSGTSPGLEWSLSVFNNFIQNYISLAQVVDEAGRPVVIVEGNRTYQYRQASAQLYGLEGTLSWHPAGLNGFSLDNGFALVYGYNRGAQFAEMGINGEYLPLIPPPRLTSMLTQNLPTKGRTLSDLFVRADIEVNGAQNRYLALSRTETPTAGYALVGLGAGAQVRYARKRPPVRVLVQVNNMFDAVYQSNLSRLKYFEYFSQSPDGRRGIYGMGRNLSLKLTFPLE